ncbi:conserved hypothetical protein [Leishmania major strain Friedlin]|uniref:RING-type domain-containing protein n=1 Tax=Leishmania major TaxID=5664 RepID=Q4QC66_LEIMA|nr:conserved hypothetical protein [Leishmania major strain Friedlin]CAG9573529.1 Ring_finger_domain/RING-H2_zinc_finger/Zinc_finger_-_C3HC4_type_(RING_finger)_containing_protein_-_putative [Leishmania major strain Friedlin]CAJ04735.1 conserved hypothetical protein [Leishmania major strain Friedlin]|eukprot:XP_001683082.1 conserved hypothetical protein [Leishmania major strain Friedlin]
MFPSGFPSSAAGSGNSTADTTAPHMHVHTVVINVGDADGTAVGGNAGVADVFSGVPATVSAVMAAAMDLSNLPGLVDLLSDTTPASTAAREWHAQGCPPFSPEEVISTFDVVQLPLSSPVTATASTSHGDTDGADTAGSPSPPAPEVKECPICLEPLFQTSVVRAAPESVPSSAPSLSELPTAGREKPATASESPPLQSQAPSSPPSVPPSDAAASADAARPLAHDDTAEATKDAKTVREVYCGHRFHESCILRWITLGHYSCPLCRSPFVFE